MMNAPIVKRDRNIPIISLLRYFYNPCVLGLIIGIFTFCVLFFIVFTVMSPERYDLQVGDISSEPIAAPRDVEDRAATEEAMEEARNRVPEIYGLNQQITAAVITDTISIFEELDAVREMARQDLIEMELEYKQKISQIESQENTDEETEESENNDENNTEIENEAPVLEDVINDEFIARAQQGMSMVLSRDDITAVVLADDNDFKYLREKLIDNLGEMLENGIKQEQLSEYKNLLRDEIQGMPISNEIKMLGISIGLPQLKANMLYDPEKTLDEREKAAESVEKVIYKKGQFIIQAGQPITHSQIDILTELGLLKDQQIDISLTIGIGLMVFVILMLLVLYLCFFEKDIIKQPLMLSMMSIILCIVLGLSYVTSHLNPYFSPVAMAGMLLTVLLNSRIAVIASITMALLTGVMSGGHMGIALVALIGGLIGTYLVNNPHQRNALIWAGLGISASSMLVIYGYEMIFSGGWFTSLQTSLWGAGSGILAAVLTIGTLPMWENLFGIITPIKLLELSNPNQSILKRLLTEAPGTYHHSIIVANLAESAADAVGANGLLARIGAYYHDIGKLENPHYFKENQLYSENPHDKMDPYTSRDIIISHTQDGVNLAKKYKVPKILQDFILQHHGTTAVAYFFHKAKKDSDGKDLNLDDFRYEGPKPSYKETAIVMMADTIEAAVRALSDPTPEKVEALIRKLIKEKLDDGQLDECHLTLKNLDSIARAFYGVICGIFHERVEYPDMDSER